MADLNPKQRMAIPRQPMPEQEALERRANFFEVAQGLTPEMALQEAERCLQCKNEPCVAGCPVEVPIPQFIMALREGDMREAVRVLKSKNNLPAICGRVCPQETQCEILCTVGKRHEPVAIGRLERYVADWELAQGVTPPEKPEPTGKSVAVIGCGPAGLTCAGDLAKMGHSVEIFESLHAPGGVLIYGIPEFRLPKDVVRAEVDYVESLGVEIHLGRRGRQAVHHRRTVGRAGFDAIFLGTGAGLPVFLRVPGTNYIGVYSANEFLTRVNLMKGYSFPKYDTPVSVGKKVAVIGAGNVAMDSARCALRLGAMQAASGRRAARGAHCLSPLAPRGAGPRRRGAPRRRRRHHL